MRRERLSGLSFALAALVGLGCSGPMKAGTPKKPDSKPNEDGGCPGGHSLCGTGAFVLCVDLQSDPRHCGSCDRDCSPGIACEAGICQQTSCTGPVAVSDHPSTSAPATGSKGAGGAGYQLLADVNGDRHLDLVEYQIASYANPFRVSIGQPGGGFATPGTYPSSLAIWSISAADVNDDGNDDLLVLSTAAPSTPPYRMDVWLGHPDGHLTQDSSAAIGAVTNTYTGADTAVGDLSGDGWPDMVLPADHDSGQIKVFLSDGTGGLHLSRSYAVGGAAAVYLRDWNGDGGADIVALTSSLKVLYNRGDGTFDEPVDCGVFLPDGAAFDVVLADFNHDTRSDLAMSTRSGNSIGVILRLGECQFSPIAFYDIPSFSLLRSADMNGDGQLDLVAIGVGPYPQQDHLLSILLGNPDGTFQTPGAPIALGADSISDLDIGETTGDGRPDIVVHRPQGQTETWRNVCQ